MRKARVGLVLMLAVGIIFSGISNLYADQMSEAILKLLIKKGIITQREVDGIKAEIAKEEPRLPKTVTEKVARLEEKQKRLPAWIENMKLKGDLRLRYQWDKQKDTAERHRGRIRYRLGLETRINQWLKVAAGLASGGTDPKSTNQTFENTFTTKGINLDYAYLQYSPTTWATLLGGKMKRKPILWEPADLLWDTDINPEGGAILLTKECGDFDLFLNSGCFVLDEASGDSSDPVLIYFQPGAKWDFHEDASLKVALTSYSFSGVQGATLDDSEGGNTLTNSLLEFDYRSLSPALELTVDNPFNGLVKFGAIFAETVSAYDIDDNNNGYLYGFKFGDKKLKKFGQWQAKYMYRRLEGDAWVDAFPDADVYSGGTNAKAHEIIFDFGLSKNLALGLDYYYVTRIAGTKTPLHRLQVDLKSKF
jgi:hypothetical protein